MDPVISTTSRYSDRILDRRKELFPSKSQQADSDDDWNNIKPFSNESSLDGTLLQESENYYLAIDSIDNDIIYTNTTSIDLQNQPDIDTNISDLKCINSNLANSLGNYSSDEIIYDSEDSNLSLPGNNLIFPMSHHSNLLSTPHMDKEFAFSEMSPLCVSPMTNGSSKSPYQMKTTVSDIRSPSEKLKTPSESFSTNSAVPKLMRKSVGDGSFSDSDNRDKNPKVRTALFKDKLKNSGDKFERKTYLCNRVKRRRNGQINAGVRHGIKKMRRNKQSVAVKTALNIIKKFKSENNQKHNISNEQLSKMDDILKSIDFQNKNFQKPDPIENLASNDSVEEVESFSDDEILSSSDCRKRVRSPSPDPNRKFFKSSRTKSVVTINKNIKLQVDTGKISLIEKAKNKRRKLNNAFNVSTDFNEDAEPSVSIDTILSSLDDNKENFRDNVENKSVNVLSQNSFNKNILAESINQTSSSKTQNYTPTQSKIQTLNEHKSNNIKEALLSPTSQMCDMASELALNSPKKGVLNINKAFNIDLTENQINSANSDLDMEQKKLFPIFYTSHRVQKLRDDTSMSTVPNAKKFRALDKNQMLLDAGQKRWGATLCGECHIVYHMGDPGDEIMHQNFHNAINVFKFQVGYLNTFCYTIARIVYKSILLK